MRGFSRTRWGRGEWGRGRGRSPQLRHTPGVACTVMAAAPYPRALPTERAERFAVVDVETNGLSDRRHRLLQIAVVTVDADGTVADRWATFVRPRFGRVGPTHIHGLTAGELRQAPTFAAVAPALLERLDGAVFTAHNAEFDWGFVSQSLRRAGYHPPDAARL